MTIAANSTSRTGKNVIKTLAKNHQNNLESDCTEKINNLTQNFQYEKDINHYWSAPNFLYCMELFCTIGISYCYPNCHCICLINTFSS